LRRQDFADGYVTLAIAGVTQEAVGTRRFDLAWLLHFDETEQCLMLDPASIRQLEAAFGTDTDLWAGRRAVLMVEAKRIALREARQRRAPVQLPLTDNVVPLVRRACGEPAGAGKAT
jgi:hypothetical protein